MKQHAVCLLPLGMLLGIHFVDTSIVCSRTDVHLPPKNTSYRLES